MLRAAVPARGREFHKTGILAFWGWKGPYERSWWPCVATEYLKCSLGGLPGESVVKTPCYQYRAWVLSMARKLTCCMPRKERKEERKKCSWVQK